MENLFEKLRLNTHTFYWGEGTRVQYHTTYTHQKPVTLKGGMKALYSIANTLFRCGTQTQLFFEKLRLNTHTHFTSTLKAREEEKK